MTAVMRKENVWKAIEAADGSHLSPEAVAAEEAILEAIQTVCCVYNADVL